MNTFETLYSRKSVRSYTGEQITQQELNAILKAANAAPVGLAQYENVHLTVITNAELLHQIDRAGAAKFGKSDIHPLYNAPMLILISARMPSVGRMENVTYSNAAIIAQNMALAATELGVGVCHIWGATAAIASSADLMSKLTLPDGFVPCCAITLGKTEYIYSQREIPENRIATNLID